MSFTTWNKAYEYQQSLKGTYDNGFSNSVSNTGIMVIDDIPFGIGEVVWVAMNENANLDDYEEWATEYGVNKSGKWCAVEDGHCS
ncbi:MAG: hypothetical protein LLF98_02820 [Clostridium sp.]|uniref:hypothetical protein n=1 Tax=Clostridium sp. TaxID=1506 RepID=UPI0025C364DE|nr:hypothetical protein [Clostridium sp.]MCE5220217.1 hypothetical protein [Clostridium sp.]